MLNNIVPTTRKLCCSSMETDPQLIAAVQVALHILPLLNSKVDKAIPQTSWF